MKHIESLLKDVREEINPCKSCDIRTERCHGACQKYNEFKLEYGLIKDLLVSNYNKNERPIREFFKLKVEQSNSIKNYYEGD